MMRWKTLASLLLVCFLFGTLAISCGDDDDTFVGESGFTVVGHVYDSITRNPMAAVRLSWGDTVLNPNGVYSDDAGKYSIGIPSNGDRFIYARTDGYYTKGRAVPLPGPSGLVTKFDFELVPVDDTGLAIQ